MQPDVVPLASTSDYVLLLLGGLASMVSGLLSWKAAQRSITVTFLMLVASTTLAWLLFQACFLGMHAMDYEHYLGRLWCGLAVACALPAPVLSGAGVLRWALRERIRARQFMGSLLLVVLYVAMARKVMRTGASPGPQELCLGLLPLALAILSWQASQRWIPVTFLLLLAGAGGVWLTSTMKCPGDMVIGGELLSYASAPFGCGPLMPFMLPLPVLSLVGIGQWVRRRRAGEQSPPQLGATP